MTRHREGRHRDLGGDGEGSTGGGGGVVGRGCLHGLQDDGACAGEGDGVTGQAGRSGDHRVGEGSGGVRGGRHREGRITIGMTRHREGDRGDRKGRCTG